MRMNRDGANVRVMISGMHWPRGLTTVCFPTNDTHVTTRFVSSATTTLADNTNPAVTQSDVAIVTGMLNTTDFKFLVERLKNMI